MINRPGNTWNIASIDILKGPGSVLSGQGAIGGAVNVIDKRIPTRVPDEAFHLDAFGSVDSATNLRSGAASLDVGVSSNLVAHIDGSYRKSGDAAIGGFQLAPALRAELLEEAAEKAAAGEPDEAAEYREAADQRGVIPNSGTESWTINAGLGLILGESTFGASLGWYDTNYGVIKRPGLEHEHGGAPGAPVEEEDETVRIGLQQFRADFKGDVYLGDGAFERLKLRAGYSDYTHTEFEGGEVGTGFP
ncbi:MAG: hypothetical protein CFE32_16570 [Alphaproteobacteria bacterium PA3]|nr:MAG: hypothetical protein CFE32_16570 [Alphaproteobacteria bacterium PA3]